MILSPIYAADPRKFTLSAPTGTETSANISGSNGQLRVSAQFYAWAHDQQMPIRRVMINWGDGQQAVTNTGKFKNHKPRCQREADEELGRCGWAENDLIHGYACGADTDCSHLGANPGGTDNTPECITTGSYADTAWFGDTTDACSESYFNYNHVYVCEGATSVGNVTCDANTTTNCWNSTVGACQYQPKVQVKDNWGWCNGVCDNDGVVEDGCYTDESFDGDDNCYSGFPSDASPNQKPWKYYDGYIYVTP